MAAAAFGSAAAIGIGTERSLAVEWFFVSPAFIAFVQGCLGTWNAVARHRSPVLPVTEKIVAAAQQTDGQTRL